MMKKYLSTLIGLCIAMVSFSQNPNENRKEVTITGKIIEASTGAALEYATVGFYK